MSFNHAAGEDFAKASIMTSSIRGDYMRDIIDRTMTEIHASMKTVFGPYATDAWITMNDMPYYTRDGKEVFASIQTDNELVNYIRKIMYQAADNQARKVGDGTTTLFVLYSNLYNAFRSNWTNLSKVSLTDLRRAYNEIVTDLNGLIRLDSMQMSDDMMKSMFYTCTQDLEMSAAIYNRLHQAIRDEAYIFVTKSNIETDLEITTQTKPHIKATKVYGSPGAPATTINRAAIFFVNGALDLVDPATLAGIGASTAGGLRSVVILCGGLTESTRRTLKAYDAIVNGFGEHERRKLNPIYVFTLDNFNAYSEAEIEDLTTLIYERPFVAGLENSVTFEAQLYQAFYMAGRDPNDPNLNESLSKFDSAMSNLTDIKDAFNRVVDIEYTPHEGIQMDFINLPKAIHDRFKMLKDSLTTEKSPLKRLEIKNRIKKLYGQYIEVSVGATLIKDSQRKFELVMDAITSAGDAVKHGVLNINSLYNLLDITSTVLGSQRYSGYQRDLLRSIHNAVEETITDLISNKFVDESPKAIKSAIRNSLAIEDDHGDPIPQHERHFNLSGNVKKLDDIFSPDFKFPEETLPDGTTIKLQVIEPVTIIQNLLENSTMMLELACAKMFNLNGYMNNFMD